MKLAKKKLAKGEKAEACDLKIKIYKREGERERETKRDAGIERGEE